MESYIPKPRQDKRWPRTIKVVGWMPESPVMIIGTLGRESEWRSVNVQTLRRTTGYCIRDFMDTSDDSYLWIVPRCYEWLCQMQAWNAVEDGDVFLTGHDERQSRGPRCIVESPPTIVQFADDEGNDGPIFADPGNWGFSCASCTSPMSAMEELVLFVQAYHNLLKQCNLGAEWRLTAASQAWHGWRLNYMDEKIERLDGSLDELMIGRGSYGGRCEAYQLGVISPPGGIYHVDANQLYSGMAKICDVPTEMLYGVTQEECSKNAICCVADVTLNAGVPAFPYRASTEHGSDGSDITIWPVGEFRTTLCGPELHMAFTLNAVRRVHSAWEYVCHPVLRSWAESLWQFRKCNQGMAGSVSKAVALGLYGKFGQKKKEWQLCDSNVVPPPNMLVGDWYEVGPDGIQRYRTLGGLCCKEVHDGWQDNCSPMISAWITSMARVQLFYWLSTAYGHVYYCDTDSLMVDHVGYGILQDSGEMGTGLGQLRDVAHYDSVDIRGLRYYVADGKPTIAGVPESAALDESARHAVWVEPEGFNEALAGRRLPDARQVMRGATLRFPYRHGAVGPDGIVSPHRLN